IAQAERMIEGDLHTRLLHHVVKLLIPLVRAQGVEGDPHLDPLAGLVREGPRHALADLPLPPDVGLEMDALARLRDVVEKWGEERVAVLQYLDGVAWHDGRAREVEIGRA